MTADDYRDLVSRVMMDALARGPDVTRAFSASGAAPASAVADALATFSWESLSIYAREASRDVWAPDRVRAHALRAGHPARILVEDPSAAASPTSALPDLADLVRDGLVRVRALAGADLGRHPHLAVADGRHVRVERDATARRAVTVFGDRELGAKAGLLFGALWDRATPLAFPARAAA